MKWQIGPYHSELPGPLRLSFNLDGEQIESAEVESGFCHRGIEKLIQSTPWFTVMALVDRIEPESALFSEHAFSMAVEEFSGIKTPKRAEMIRMMASEINRISSHLGFVARMARAAGSMACMHYALRDREKLLDLLELLTGARFNFNYFRFGGVNQDVTDGFLDRILEVCDWLLLRIKEYNDLLTYHHAFQSRTQGLGVLKKEHIEKWGITGPNARASGIVEDWRVVGKYSFYHEFDFGDEVIETRGDAHSRFLIRLRELRQSAFLLRSFVQKIEKGPFLGERPDQRFVAKKGEAFVRVEGPRGVLGWHVISDGNITPGRVQVQTPSQFTLQCLPEILKGVRLSDFPIVLASLDLNLLEADK